MSSPLPPAGAGIDISSKRTRIGTQASDPAAGTSTDRAQDAAAYATEESTGGRGGSIPKAIVAPSYGAAAGDSRRYGRRAGYSTDTDSSAGSGRGRKKKTSSKRNRSRTSKNGKSGSHHNLHEHQHHPNGVTETVTRNGYHQQNGIHHRHNTRGAYEGGSHNRTGMPTCYEAKAEDTKMAAAGGSSRTSDGMGSADEGVPSHVGLVHSVLSRCASGYDSGSIGDGLGGGAGNAGDADSQKSLDLSESQADQVNSDRDEPFDSRYRDVDNSSQCDTSQAEDTSQADTAQYLGHSDRDSIAGYHTDTGAMSDGNSITAPKQHNPSSRGGSVVGMSERSRSSGGAGSGIADRPPGRVTIARPIQHPPMPPMVVGPGAGFHSLEAIASLHHNYPTANTSYGGPPSLSGKSDNATVNSGSMIEDIDMASIMSGDGSILIGGGGEKGQQRTFTPPPSAAADTTTGAAAAASQYSSHQGMLSQHPILTKRSAEHSHHKHDRGVEFATWAQSYPAPHPWLEGQPAASTTSKPSKSSTPPGTVVGVAPTGALLNDMGPPLTRSILLERIAGATDSMPSGHSRSGSVASGSVGRAPSDVSAHVDTDDCGGSIGELSDDTSKAPSAPSVPPVPKGEHGKRGDNGNGGIVDTALPSSSQTDLARNGRQSPGGTIYRGRGIRRYQGRHRRGRSRSRSRSRSRDREEEEEEDRRDRRMTSRSRERAQSSSRSPSPHWGNDGCVRRSRRNRGRR